MNRRSGDRVLFEDAGLAATLFHALAEPTRLALLEHLLSGEHRVRDLVEHLDLAQSTVSKHLACLRECGLVTTRVEGRSSWYSLTDPGRLRTLGTDAVAVLAAGDPTPTLHEHLARAGSSGEDH